MILKSQSPLVTILFALDEVRVIRHWYHVPRVGDEVDLVEYSEPRMPRVTNVMWGDRFAYEADTVDVTVVLG